jgi:hypothetical protein
MNIPVRAALPAIQSVGAPHERHADRIVGEMLRLMAANYAQVTAAIGEVIRDASDGTPRGQRKMAMRIRAAGATHIHLRTGTRGRYTLMVDVNTGWDPFQDARIKEGDPLPHRPWIACWNIVIDGRKRGPPVGMPVVLVSHHAFSRAAQRWGARTVGDLLAVVAAIRTGAWEYVLRCEPDAEWWRTPPAGIRVAIGGDRDLTVVLQEHKMYTLVAATVLAEGEAA